jgi:hypothetical protein
LIAALTWLLRTLAVGIAVHWALIVFFIIILNYINEINGNALRIVLHRKSFYLATVTVTKKFSTRGVEPVGKCR